MNKFELQPIDSFPPDFEGEDLYVGSVRKSLGIQDNETGRIVREKLRSLWGASKGEEDGFSTRYKIMEVLFGDRVGDEFGGLGAFALHISDPMMYDDFLRTVPSGYMWRQEDLAQYSHEL